ncbi:MAG: class I SAM-dependent methyltransferase [Nitrososphaerota archaeon]|nr:class I SAM-dependent methyltransferase [Nitrososphaerota archaeon]
MAEARRTGNTPQDLFYRECNLTDWQMTDSERLALKGILESLRPSCSLEIGTYRGGSLSLIRQYSSHTISLDKDPGVRNGLPDYPNVEFVTGESASKLARLLSDIYDRNLDLQFVLLDGDHSREAVRRDLNILLGSISPRSRTVLVMHDTFNPSCRRGILEADWKTSKHLAFVELDLVPGRLIESPGAGCGELWGGFGIAVFVAQPTVKCLKISESSRLAHEVLAALALDRNSLTSNEMAAIIPPRTLPSRVKSRLKHLWKKGPWNNTKG